MRLEKGEKRKVEMRMEKGKDRGQEGGEGRVERKSWERCEQWIGNVG